MLWPQVPFMIQFIEHLARDEERTDSIVACCAGLFGSVPPLPSPQLLIPPTYLQGSVHSVWDQHASSDEQQQWHPAAATGRKAFPHQANQVALYLGPQRNEAAAPEQLVGRPPSLPLCSHVPPPPTDDEKLQCSVSMSVRVCVCVCEERRESTYKRCDDAVLPCLILLCSQPHAMVYDVYMCITINNMLLEYLSVSQVHLDLSGGGSRLSW